MGPDGLLSAFLKKVASGISFPLMLIFSQSFQCGKIPDIWKTATVFKKSLSCDVNNYRPISLTGVCCKIMDNNQTEMLDYLLRKKLISEHQDGVLSNHSCLNVSTIGHWLFTTHILLMWHT